MLFFTMACQNAYSQFCTRAADIWFAIDESVNVDNTDRMYALNFIYKEASDAVPNIDGVLDVVENSAPGDLEKSVRGYGLIGMVFIGNGARNGGGLLQFEEVTRTLLIYGLGVQVFLKTSRFLPSRCLV